MERLSDVMSNINLTLYRRLVPAGMVSKSYLSIHLIYEKSVSSLVMEGKGKWCVAKYGDPYLEFVLCI